MWSSGLPGHPALEDPNPRRKKKKKKQRSRGNPLLSPSLLCEMCQILSRMSLAESGCYKTENLSTTSGGFMVMRKKARESSDHPGRRTPQSQLDPWTRPGPRNRAHRGGSVPEEEPSQGRLVPGSDWVKVISPHLNASGSECKPSQEDRNTMKTLQVCTSVRHSLKTFPDIPVTGTRGGKKKKNRQNKQPTGESNAGVIEHRYKHYCDSCPRK